MNIARTIKQREKERKKVVVGVGVGARVEGCLYAQRARALVTGSYVFLKPKFIVVLSSSPSCTKQVVSQTDCLGACSCHVTMTEPCLPVD